MEMALRQTVTAKRHTPPWIERTLFWLAVTVGLAVAVALAAAIVFSHRPIQQAAQAVPGPPNPSARMVLCRSGPTAACARAAATKIDVPVAWMETPRGFAFALLVAVPANSKRSADRAFAYERFTSADAVLELTTGPRAASRADGPTVIARTRTPRDIPVRIVGLGASSVSAPVLEWSRDRVRYQLIVTPNRSFGRGAPPVSELLAMIDAVSYTAPRGA
jgi:hypothetical protein